MFKSFVKYIQTIVKCIFSVQPMVLVIDSVIRYQDKLILAYLG